MSLPICAAALLGVGCSAWQEGEPLGEEPPTYLVTPDDVLTTTLWFGGRECVDLALRDDLKVIGHAARPATPGASQGFAEDDTVSNVTVDGDGPTVLADERALGGSGGSVFLDSGRCLVVYRVNG